jgi:hypothetical protein
MDIYKEAENKSTEWYSPCHISQLLNRPVSSVGFISVYNPNE